MQILDHPKFVYWLRDPFWGVINYAAYYALRLLPAHTVSGIGGMLGVAAGRFRFPELTARCEHSLGIIRPDFTAAQRADVVRRMWSNVGRAEAEMAVLERLSDEVDITLVGQRHFEEPMRAGRPIVFVFPHLGNWEALAIVGRRHGVILNVIYEELKNRFERRLAEKSRRKIGYRLIPPNRAGLREIVLALERGEALGIAIDEYRDGNVIAPAFGRAMPDESNIRYALRLARKYGAALVPVVCIRTSPHNFELTVHEEMRDPLAENLNSLCESWIRAHPEQWYMLHRLQMPNAV